MKKSCPDKGPTPMFRKIRHSSVSILILASMTVFTRLSGQEARDLKASLKADLKASLLGLLPKQGEWSGWRMESEPRFYEPDNLWEYIDGAADLYLLYGFRMVIAVEYVMGLDSSSVNVEIYCMESPTHAFGMYAAERSPEEQPVAIGAQGYQGANVLNFYKGPYYIKMTSFSSSSGLSASLNRMGRSISDNIPGEFKELELFQVFPPENRVVWSERYIPNDFLGQSYLTNGYRCDYEGDQGTFQVFLVPLQSEEAARSAIKKYRSFLESQEFKIQPQGDDRSMIAEKGRYILAFAYRSYFGGVLDVGDLTQGQLIAETMRKNLSNW
jgi:hypothetical protein